MDKEQYISKLVDLIDEAGEGGMPRSEIIGMTFITITTLIANAVVKDLMTYGDTSSPRS